MKRKLIFFLIIAAGFLLQTSVFPYLPFGGACPNLLLIIIGSFALMKGSRTGMWVGFFSGLFMDLFFGYYLGMYALLFMYAGAVCGLFQKRYYPDDIKLPLLLVSISDLSCNLAVFLFLFLLRGRTDFGFYMKNAILPELVFTVVVTIFLYPLLLKIGQWMENAENRGIL